jgi:hypothetical protein
MLLLEINEFNPQLMALAAERLNGKNLRRLLALRHSKTSSPETEERFGLDPWVQWVSIHTGRPAAEHGVAHLGDVPVLRYPQLWQSLSQQGWRYGVWGAMNASRGAPDNCAFFFPDPWTFSEDAYPSELNDLLALPRYFSKHYGDLKTAPLLKTAAQLLRFCLRPSIAASLLPHAPKLLGSALRHGLREHMLFALFDLVNVILFSRYYKRHKPDFSLLFLNSLAHLQHHKWTEEDGLSAEMQAVFGLIDTALGILFATLDSQHWVVANAFSQRCSLADNEFLYRQHNPEQFLQSVGIAFLRVEQAMTNDGHVFFSDAAQAQQAAQVLRAATVDGIPAFAVDYREGASRLFYQLVIWQSLTEQASLQINQRQWPFFSLFATITQRSGSHVPEGDVFSDHLHLPKHMANHELHEHILRDFALRSQRGRHD